MNNKQQRYVLFRHFKLAYGIHLKDAHLDDIQDQFHELRRQSVFNVGMYRFINFALSLVAIILWFIIPDENLKWFFFGIWIAFSIYNFLHFIVNIVEYRRIRIPERLSDADDNGGN